MSLTYERTEVSIPNPNDHAACAVVFQDLALAETGHSAFRARGAACEASEAPRDYP